MLEAIDVCSAYKIAEIISTHYHAYKVAYYDINIHEAWWVWIIMSIFVHPILDRHVLTIGLDESTAFSSEPHLEWSKAFNLKTASFLILLGRDDWLSDFGRVHVLDSAIQRHPEPIWALVGPSLLQLWRLNSFNEFIEGSVRIRNIVTDIWIIFIWCRWAFYCDCYFGSTILLGGKEGACISLGLVEFPTLADNLQTLL